MSTRGHPQKYRYILVATLIFPSKYIDFNEQ